MATTKEIVKEIEQPKEVELVVHEVEDIAIIVNVQGWRMRVYFDVDTDKEKFGYGQTVSVKYLGNIEDPHSIRFEKLK